LLDALSPSDLDFLDALRHGESANDYARRISYSVGWAKKKSRAIRDKLGVASIREAVEMSTPETISRQEFDALKELQERTADALDDLRKAATPAEKQEAREQVQTRELDEKEMAKRLGISTDAVATIGDMQNDLAMFRKSGLSIAMGNATDDVKKAATHVTASNEDDGFARAVDMILSDNETR